MHFMPVVIPFFNFFIRLMFALHRQGVSDDINFYFFGFYARQGNINRNASVDIVHIEGRNAF